MQLCMSLKNPPIYGHWQGKRDCSERFTALPQENDSFFFLLWAITSSKKKKKEKKNTSAAVTSGTHLNLPSVVLQKQLGGDSREEMKTERGGHYRDEQCRADYRRPSLCKGAWASFSAHFSVISRPFYPETRSPWGVAVRDKAWLRMEGGRPSGVDGGKNKND